MDLEYILEGKNQTGNHSELAQLLRSLVLSYESSLRSSTDIETYRDQLTTLHSLILDNANHLSSGPEQAAIAFAEISAFAWKQLDPFKDNEIEDAAHFLIDSIARNQGVTMNNSEREKRSVTMLKSYYQAELRTGLDRLAVESAKLRRSSNEYSWITRKAMGELLAIEQRKIVNKAITIIESQSINLDSHLYYSILRSLKHRNADKLQTVLRQENSLNPGSIPDPDGNLNDRERANRFRESGLIDAEESKDVQIPDWFIHSFLHFPPS